MWRNPQSETSPSVRRRQSGFTLVELMVSITIGLVILGAMVALFINTSKANREMARANNVIENGRLAAELIKNDVVHAGFWGTYVPPFDDQTYAPDTYDPVTAGVPTGAPDPCLAYSAPWTPQYMANLIAIPIQAYDDSSLICSGVAAGSDKQPGTDMLVVRHAELCVPDEATGSGTCETDDPAKLYIQASRCTSDPVRYVFGDSGFTLRQRDCATEAEKRKFVSDIYFIRNYAVTPGDGVPTLMRSQFDLVSGVPAHQPAVAMVEGIEGFSVELGVDSLSKTGDAVDYSETINWDPPEERTTPTNRGDSVPDGDFVHCAPDCTVDQLVNVTAVKLYLLVRSRETSPGYTDTKVYTMGGGTTVGPFNDHFKRHLFVTTVRLPNVAGRRETP